MSRTVSKAGEKPNRVSDPHRSGNKKLARVSSCPVVDGGNVVGAAVDDVEATVDNCCGNAGNGENDAPGESRRCLFNNGPSVDSSSVVGGSAAVTDEDGGGSVVDDTDTPAAACDVDAPGDNRDGSGSSRTLRRRFSPAVLGSGAVPVTAKSAAVIRATYAGGSGMSVRAQ